MVSDEVLKLLNEYGWQFHEKCRCNGVLKHKYRHPKKAGFELEIWVHYQQFQIKERNKTMVSATKLDQLKTILQTI